MDGSFEVSVSMVSCVTFACMMLRAREVNFTEVRSVMLMNSWIKIRKFASLVSVPELPAVPSIALLIIVVTSTNAWEEMGQECILGNLPFGSGKDFSFEEALRLLVYQLQHQQIQ